MTAAQVELAESARDAGIGFTHAAALRYPMAVIWSRAAIRAAAQEKVQP